MQHHPVCVYLGEALANYGFGAGHPFGHQRLPAFHTEFLRLGLDQHVCIQSPILAGHSLIEKFHAPEYVARVKLQSASGLGYLDYGDTPAVPGIFEAASYVVGSTVDAVRKIMDGTCRRVFIPIAGLHHARRDRAAGFCVFNDCGVAIEILRAEYNIQRIAYIDIDAHHGDGVFYSYEDDPDLIFIDLHQDGRTLYPGTGAPSETGKGNALGTKLNIAMPPGATDKDFIAAWAEVEKFLAASNPQFILLQCGADSIAGDPITAMRYSPLAHAHATRSLCELAEKLGHGRVLAMGGGGYDLGNLASAWNAVVQELINTPMLTLNRD